MPDAILRISATGGAEVRRILGQILQDVRAVQNEIVVETRRSSDATTRILGNEASARRRQGNETVATRRRTVDEENRVERDGLAQRMRDHSQASNERRRIAEQESQHGQQLQNSTQRDRERARQSDVQQEKAASQSRLRVAQGEAKEREKLLLEQMARGRGSRWGERAANIAMNVGSVASQVGQEWHDQTQRDRFTRASSSRSLNSALFQAGVSGSEALAMRASVFKQAESMGMDEGQLAQAIAQGQTETSFLTGKTADERKQNLQAALRYAQLGHDTYQDPGEVMRVAGVLKSVGMQQQDIEPLLKTLIAESMAGAIELGSVSREALGPMMRNVANATVGKTGAERQAALQQEFARSMGVAEIARQAGLTPRDSLNALSKLSSAVRDDPTMGKLYNRLRARTDGAGLVNELFTTAKDDTGQTVHRLKNNDPLVLMQRLMGIYKGDSTALLNMLHGGGHDRPMILDAQTRRLVGALAQGEAGKTGFDRVGEFTGMTLTDQQIGEGHALREGEFFTQEDRRTIGRRNRTDVGMSETPSFARDAATISNRVADFAGQHPLLTMLGGAGLRLGMATPWGRAAMTGLGAGVFAGEGINRLLDWGLEKTTGRPRGNVEPISLMNPHTLQETAANLDFLNPFGAATTNAQAAIQARAQAQRLGQQIVDEEAGGSVNDKLGRVRQLANAGLDPQVILPLLQAAIRQGVKEGFEGASVSAVVNPSVLSHAPTTPRGPAR